MIAIVIVVISFSCTKEQSQNYDKEQIHSPSDQKEGVHWLLYCYGVLTSVQFDPEIGEWICWLPSENCLPEFVVTDGIPSTTYAKFINAISNDSIQEFFSDPDSSYIGLFSYFKEGGFALEVLQSDSIKICEKYSSVNDVMLYLVIPNYLDCDRITPEDIIFAMQIIP